LFGTGKIQVLDSVPGFRIQNPFAGDTDPTSFACPIAPQRLISVPVLEKRDVGAVKEQLMNSNKTYSLRKEDAVRNWYLVDAKNKILGRLATEIAKRLRGKTKPDFTPHVDNGDFIVVINAEQVRTTGNKLEDKKYYRHTGYPGGIKETSLKELLQKKPEQVLYKSVKGMLPKTRLGRAQLKKLKIYSGPDHPHQAQTPAVLDIETGEQS
jgi:large subunit ribosomal protein L13